MRPTNSARSVGAFVESGILMLVATVSLLGTSVVWLSYFSQASRSIWSIPLESLMLAGLGAWCGYWGIRRLLDAGKVSLHDDAPD